MTAKPKYLFFAGYPRSGSTLLGQIINYHPNCLVSNEFRALDFIIKDSHDIDDVMSAAAEDAQKLLQTGLENYKNYNINKFQDKWKNTDFLYNNPVLKKRDIKLIGDKKAGSTTKLYNSHKNEFLKFLKLNPDIFFIKIERDIESTCKSYVKSHPHEARDVASAREKILDLDNKSNEFLDNVNHQNKYVIKYESLVNNPRLEIYQLFCFLNLNTQPEIINLISKLVNK